MQLFHFNLNGFHLRKTPLYRCRHFLNQRFQQIHGLFHGLFDQPKQSAVIDRVLQCSNRAGAGLIGYRQVHDKIVSLLTFFRI